MAIHTQCPRCNQPVPAGAHVCPHCGTHLQELDQTHPAPTPTSAAFAPSIGQPASQAQVVHTPAPPVAFQSALPDVLKQMDAAATNNITISGVLIAFYAGAIFAGKVQASELFNALIYALPIVLLLITVILSMRVFYSTGYLTDDYPTLLKKKDARLRLSMLALGISLAWLAVSVFVYLQRTAL